VVDQDLVVRAQNGDREACETLARASARRLYLAAHRIVRDSDRADDAVQQTLVAMWRELPSLRDPDRFEAWTYRLVVRFCLSDWSPAGFDGPSDLVTIHPDGTGRTTVMSVGPRGGQTPQPAWSPDGSRILFVQPDGSMATVAVDGSALAPAVATGLGRGLHPRYRPAP
jgi:hypothetical protein